MTFVVLLALAAAAGLIAAAIAFRYPYAAPGATAAPVVEAVADAARRHERIRRWARARRDPAASTGLAMTIALAVVAGGGAVLGVVAYLVRTNDTLREIDAAAAQWGNDNATEFSDGAIELVTQLGETWLVIVAGLALVVIGWTRRRDRFVPLFLLAVILGDKVVTTTVKALADRARPSLNPIAETLGPSFPSGHTSTAAAFFAAAALIAGRGRSGRGRAALAGGAVAVAVAVACSRVFLGVHWLSDVIAGLALGWAWFALCAIAFGGRLLRFGETAERIGSATRERAGRARARPRV